MEPESKRKKENTNLLPIIPWDVLFLIFNKLYERDCKTNTTIRLLCKKTYNKYPRFGNKLFLKTWYVFNQLWEDRIDNLTYMKMHTIIYNCNRREQNVDMFVFTSREFIDKKYHTNIDKDFFFKRVEKISKLVSCAYRNSGLSFKQFNDESVEPTLIAFAKIKYGERK